MAKGRFSGKVAVITGGAHGIGRAIADAFIREGASVRVIDTTPGASRIFNHSISACKIPP